MSTMYTFLLCLVILTGIISSTPLVRILRSRPGCGPMGLNIDQILQKVNQEALIPCCDQHDKCYQTCGTKRSQCDNNFLNCLKDACVKQNPSSRECPAYASGMYSAVRGGGIPSYTRDQYNSKCASKSFDD